MIQPSEMFRCFDFGQSGKVKSCSNIGSTADDCRLDFVKMHLDILELCPLCIREDYSANLYISGK